MEKEQKDNEQNESGVIEHNETLVHLDATCVFSDQTKTALTFDQLDHAKWRAFLKDHFSLDYSSSEPITGMGLLRQMNLAFDETYVNLAALLLFGGNLSLCGTEYVIRAGVISHDSPAKADDVAMFSGTLEQIYANAFKWLMPAQLRSGHGTLLPEAVIQEVLTNALLHRDYLIAAPIRIKVYSDRVEIVSPGCLPGVANRRKRAKRVYMAAQPRFDGDCEQRISAVSRSGQRVRPCERTLAANHILQ